MLRDDLLTPRAFVVGRISVESQLESASHLGLLVLTDLCLHSLREHPGLLDDEFAVEEVEGLQGRDSPAASRRGLACIGAVEGSKNGRTFHADLVGVYHAPQSLGLKILDDGESAQSTA